MKKYEYKIIRKVSDRRQSETLLKKNLNEICEISKGEWYKISEDILIEKFHNC